MPEGLDDAQLEARLYPVKPLAPDIALPDFAQVQRELTRPGVTRLLLWQEYKAQHPDGLQYSAFCDQYRRFCAAADPVMRFEHRAGEKCFVDYAGQTVGIIDRHTSVVSRTSIAGFASDGCPVVASRRLTLTEDQFTIHRQMV